MAFKAIEPETLDENIFHLINRDWALMSAGVEGDFNMMTVSWGLFGVLWHRPVIAAFVRPGRHTHLFTEREDAFSLSFFTEAYRPQLTLCGKKSGRDIDKLKETGLTPVFGDGTVYFDEAKIVMTCKKLYVEKFDPEKFLDPTMHDLYPNRDYHTVYFGGIVSTLVKE